MSLIFQNFVWRISLQTTAFRSSSISSASEESGTCSGLSSGAESHVTRTPSSGRTEGAALGDTAFASATARRTFGNKGAAAAEAATGGRFSPTVSEMLLARLFFFRSFTHSYTTSRSERRRMTICLVSTFFVILHKSSNYCAEHKFFEAINDSSNECH